jgi:hypothetical protein
MKVRGRSAVLAVALAAALAAAGWVGGEERIALSEPSTPPPEHRRRHTAPAPSPSTLDVERLAARRQWESGGDMFGTRSWEVPRKALAPPEHAAPPEPPRFPYTFFGRLHEGAGTTLFLSRNDEILTVRAGDTIAGTWRIDQVSDGTVALTYLPLSRRQTLDIGRID